MNRLRWGWCEDEPNLLTMRHIIRTSLRSSYTVSFDNWRSSKWATSKFQPNLMIMLSLKGKHVSQATGTKNVSDTGNIEEIALHCMYLTKFLSRAVWVKIKLRQWKTCLWTKWNALPLNKSRHSTSFSMQRNFEIHKFCENEWWLRWFKITRFPKVLFANEHCDRTNTERIGRWFHNVVRSSALAYIGSFLQI